MNVFTTPNVLFCFKIGGAVLAGLGAGIKVFKEIVKKRKEKQRSIQTVDPDYPDNVVEPRAEEEPNNLFWETIELTFIIGGLVVNLAATAIDQKQTVARNDATNAQTAKQLRNAEESLNYLERLGTRFETLSFSVTLRLSPYRDYRPPDDLLSILFPNLSSPRSQKQRNWFLDLFHFHKNDQEAKIGRTYSDDVSGVTNILIGRNFVHMPFKMSNGRVQYSFNLDLSKDDIATKIASFSGHLIENDVLEVILRPQVYLNLVAAKSPEKYRNHSQDFPKSATIGFMFVSSRSEDQGHFVPCSISDTGFKGPFPLIDHPKPIFAYRHYTPSDDLGDPDTRHIVKDFYYARNASTKGDLFVVATNCNRIAHFTFIPASEELLVQLDFDCPKAGWEQTEWMTSWPDLANAILFLGVTNGPQNRPNRIVPVSGKFTFGLTTITVTNFFPCDPQNWHGCELPDKREILDMR
jgi:hypothetical protein